MQKDDIFELFAAASPGTEQALCDELRELNFKSVRLNRGGIPFRGPSSEAWRACLESRIANRIQILIKRFPAPSESALFTGIQSIDWLPYITYRQTISVSAVVQGSKLAHSGYAALKVKDAIVDQIRDSTSKRPDVSRTDADVRIFVYLAQDKAAVYLDASGEPLHRRGYRKETGEAPLRETIAAAMLKMSGWDRSSPLIDPMCGSGTIAIEAAMLTEDRAPGLSRERFGFERWANFDDEGCEIMREMRGKLRARIVNSSPGIRAYDIDETVLERARANAKAAGVRLSFKKASFLELQADPNRATVIMNPPYGVRLDANSGFCRSVATAISRLHGWRVCLLAGTKEYERLISAKPVRKHALSNADIECDFLVYDIE